MKKRIVLALGLVVIAIAAISVELIYLKKISESLSYRIDYIIELMSQERFDEALLEYEKFTEVYFENENIISVFVPDEAIDDIRSIIYETSDYFSEEETADLFEGEDIVRNLEKIKIKIRDIYFSMLPNVKNLM